MLCMVQGHCSSGTLSPIFKNTVYLSFSASSSWKDESLRMFWSGPHLEGGRAGLEENVVPVFESLCLPQNSARLHCHSSIFERLLVLQK